ncbi:MAG: rhodanese-like domain-containing protein [Anaerotignum sp.]|nr:rhodanese-like domain-containing protein [Anaerotignum sp.]
MKIIFLLLAVMWTLGGCGVPAQTENAGYQQITAEEAKELMDVWKYEIILDVREQDEYDEKHIPGAILLPVGMIDEETAAGVIPEKDTMVLVYCRSGNRSKIAASKLAELGYTQVYEFGGINDWPYETE